MTLPTSDETLKCKFSFCVRLSCTVTCPQRLDLATHLFRGLTGHASTSSMTTCHIFGEGAREGAGRRVADKLKIDFNFVGWVCLFLKYVHIMLTLCPTYVLRSWDSGRRYGSLGPVGPVRRSCHLCTRHPPPTFRKRLPKNGS